MDPNKLDYAMTTTSKNTLKKHLSQPYGYAPRLGMGYGQGWLTTSALVLDDMDSSGPLLTNIAKYSYDKNMDYVDKKTGMDWRKWLWIIPEGTTYYPMAGGTGSAISPTERTRDRACTRWKFASA